MGQDNGSYLDEHWHLSMCHFVEIVGRQINDGHGACHDQQASQHNE